MTIIVSGKPGSGKTTIIKLLSEKLGLKYIDGGKIFRKMAEDHNMNLVKFQELCNKDYSFDKKLDEKLIEYAKKNNIVMESRVLPYIIDKKNIKAFKVFLHASDKVRIKRMVRRGEGSYKEVLEEDKIRTENDRKRYKEVYGIDTNDLSVYDLIVNTDDKTPNEITDIIINKFKIIR